MGRKTSKKDEVKTKTNKPVKFLLYEEGVVNMPLSMITTKESFENLWKKRFRSQKALDEAWAKAEKFKEKNS